MEFNKKRFRELVKYSQKLKQEGKHISDISESDWRELLGYSAKNSGQLTLESLDFYLDLIVQFLEGKISAGGLFLDYLELEEWQEQIYNTLESNLIFLSPHPEEDSVGELFYNFYWVLEQRGDERPLSFEALIKDESYEEALATIINRETYNSIKEIYLELQRIGKNYRSDWQNSKDFSKLVDQLNWETKDQYFDLIEEFLDESSNFLEFKERYQSILKVAKELESNSIFLKPSYQALGFSNFIQILIQLFDSYQTDSKISPKVFKSWVQIIFLQMKNHC